MKKTVACLLLLLTVSSLILTLSPNASGQTEDVDILDYSCYVDSWGNLVVVGEVQNVGSNVICNVTVAGLATPSEGNQVETSNSVWGNYLLPGQKAPFYLEFYSQSTLSGIDTTDITLKIYHAVASAQYQYQNITITSQQGAPKSNGEYWVHGELKNVGTQTATNVAVVATFYNSEGIPIAAGYIDPIALLTAGATTTFAVPALDLNQTTVTSDKIIVSYRLLVQVISPMLTGEVPVISATSTPIPGSTTPSNTGIDQTIIYAAVIAVALVAVVAVVLLLRRRKPKEVVAREPFEPAKQTKKTRRERKKA